MRRPRLRSRRRRTVAALLALTVVVVGVAVAFGVGRSATVRTQVQTLAGTPEPGQGAVRLDTTLYLPDRTPAPAVLLAHGFGGSKDDLGGQARDLARHGYVVLAYTARGFGASGGLIHLDAPAYEVADARLMIDYLATRREVVLDAPGDPRVGVAGSSYGGALALLTGGYDRRVDAIAADITWNSLLSALLPNAVTTPAGSAGDGVFKKLWAGYLFGSAGPTAGAGSGSSVGGSGGSSGSSSDSGANAGVSAACGRFAAQLCRAYQQLAQGGVVDPSLATLLRESSPAGVVDRITAPTLLTQGEQDSLFPLSEADANARGITAHGTPVSVLWRAGGHDTGSGTDVSQSATRQWFDDALHGRKVTSDFTMTLRGAGISAQTGDRVSQTLTAPAGYPGIIARSGAGPDPDPHQQVTVHGTAQEISAPAGGSPAAISSLPGLSNLLDLGSGVTGLSALTSIPGQIAAFDSDPLPARMIVTGPSSVSMSVTSSTTDATLFVSLRDIAPDGTPTLPSQLVDPVRLTGLTRNQAEQVTVSLPSVVSQVESGHRLRLVVASTDQGYLLPTDPRTYRVALRGGSAVVSVPVIRTRSGSNGRPWLWLVVGLLTAAVAALAATALASGPRRKRADVRSGGGAVAGAGPAAAADLAPVVVTDLAKEYRDGFRAVDGVSFRVERGQIVGLLGPNGAGKTTTLRVLMGLIAPTSGQVEIFGAPIRPGSPVLSRVGAFVEGPGLLPHLSGRANLRLFWAASGRPAADAQFETALEIAGLGSSVDRKVKTYSQGMRQRLAIAQSMLGLPELLLLDEPTNGLDPPQIAEMRLVLRSYADTGRTVVISSHLLAEVEQTCTHVVVMHRGRLVAAGSVREIAGTDAVTLSVADPAAARAVLQQAGMESTEVPARRALEDVFLELVGDGS